jgi:hypothetical protein
MVLAGASPTYLPARARARPPLPGGDVEETLVKFFAEYVKTETNLRK